MLIADKILVMGQISSSPIVVAINTVLHKRAARHICLQKQTQHHFSDDHVTFLLGLPKNTQNVDKLFLFP